jgi:integrase
MNSTRDIVFKRCGCTDETTGRQLAGRCPCLAEPGHGSWYYAVQVTTVGGRKARYRRGGFANRDAAAAARQAILDDPADEAAAGAWTVARWLRYWLTQAEPHLRPSTAHGYRDDLDSESRELTITRQLVALPGELYCGPPKSRASIRTIALDEAGARRLVDQALRQTVELLRHQFTDQRRSDARARTGPGWRQGRPMFTYADGRPIRPEYLTHRFRTLVKQLDLPPIRLHDLRHGAATLALASHTDLKVIQQMLGHSSIVTTADTYTKASCPRPPTGRRRPPPTWSSRPHEAPQDPGAAGPP